MTTEKAESDSKINELRKNLDAFTDSVLDQKTRKLMASNKDYPIYLFSAQDIIKNLYAVLNDEYTTPEGKLQLFNNALRNDTSQKYINHAVSDNTDARGIYHSMYTISNSATNVDEQIIDPQKVTSNPENIDKVSKSWWSALVSFFVNLFVKKDKPEENFRSSHEVIINSTGGKENLTINSEEDKIITRISKHEMEPMTEEEVQVQEIHKGDTTSQNPVESNGENSAPTP